MSFRVEALTQYLPFFKHYRADSAASGLARAVRPQIPQTALDPKTDPARSNEGWYSNLPAPSQTESDTSPEKLARISLQEATQTIAREHLAGIPPSPSKFQVTPILAGLLNQGEIEASEIAPIAQEYIRLRISPQHAKASDKQVALEATRKVRSR